MIQYGMLNCLQNFVGHYTVVPGNICQISMKYSICFKVLPYSLVPDFESFLTTLVLYLSEFPDLSVTFVTSGSNLCLPSHVLIAGGYLVPGVAQLHNLLTVALPNVLG